MLLGGCGEGVKLLTFLAVALTELALHWDHNGHCSQIKTNWTRKEFQSVQQELSWLNLRQKFYPFIYFHAYKVRIVYIYYWLKRCTNFHTSRDFTNVFPNICLQIFCLKNILKVFWCYNDCFFDVIMIATYFKAILFYCTSK